MSRIPFGTKAETLQRLDGHLRSAEVLPVALFDTATWRRSPAEVIARVQKELDGGTVVVRSSFAGEDSVTSSMAGTFRSILGVNPKDPHSLTLAIDEVVSSYPAKAGVQQFFVQQQLTGVRISGVVFSRDLDTLAPYYVISYDDSSGLTTTVTAGSSGEVHTVVCYRGYVPKVTISWLSQLLEAVCELERLFENDSIDVEFAVCMDGTIVILQVRPITCAARNEDISAADLSGCLLKIESKIKKLNAPHPGLHGDKVLYSVMTDWNPAEMIGTRPRPLALSLYKELITDNMWAYQRKRYGYRDLRGFPLLVSFMGLPYIDVRVSLNSFVPATLNEELTGKLVNYYIGELIDHPAYHDKVEFQIVHSCYHLTLNQDLERLMPAGFTRLELERIKFSLLDLTNKMVAHHDGLFASDLARLDTLSQRYTEITESSLPVIDKIYWLIEDTKRYGTLPFAGLARAAFVAVQLLQSLVSYGIFSETDRTNFMLSLSTVARDLGRDLESVAAGTLLKDDFLKVYGHLRPGTYDILSPRYDEVWDELFGNIGGSGEARNGVHSFELTNSQRGAIASALREHGLLTDPASLLRFIKIGIEGRERGKSLFTRSVSKVLQLIGQLSTRFDISPDDSSFLSIKTILEWYSSVGSEDIPLLMRREIEQKRREYKVTLAVKLPQFVAQPEDVYLFTMGAVEPNFITSARVTDIVVLEHELPDVDLRNRIVFIRAADPGYDWIFTHLIGGLVTMYGGANSHMAIRCAEQNIPAVIGCGETNFAKWGVASILEIDCESRQVRVRQGRIDSTNGPR